MATKDEETGVEVSAPATRMSVRDDPFAVREGKTLTWRDINMKLVSFSAILT